MTQTATERKGARIAVNQCTPCNDNDRHSDKNGMLTRNYSSDETASVREISPSQRQEPNNAIRVHTERWTTMVLCHQCQRATDLSRDVQYCGACEHIRPIVPILAKNVCCCGDTRAASMANMLASAAPGGPEWEILH